MLTLDDIEWTTLEGGDRDAYDASIPLRKLERGEPSEQIWEELWNELYHQGDVGTASYAAVPQLVRIARLHSLRDWNLYALVATIESARHEGSNPQPPDWLEDSYRQAWRELLELSLQQLRDETDELTTRSILSVVAIAKGLTPLGRIISEFDAGEIEELYESIYEQDG